MLVGNAAPGSGGPDALACRTEAAVTLVVARFEYDAMNRRVARTDGATGKKTYFSFLPGGETMGEYERTGVPASPWRTVREYVWLDGRPVAQEEHPSDTERNTYAVHVDSIGLPRALTNANGQTVVERDGAAVRGHRETTRRPVSGRTVVTNLRLPGQYDERLLGSLGLQGPYYNWNRWYLPSVGRYMELDPIAKAGGFNGFYGPNWYGYAEGNPMRWTDRRGCRGLDETDEWNTADGCRLPFLITGSAPTNGMWCGDYWSGGNGTCKGQGVSPPTDSLDITCMNHDLCWAECSGHTNPKLLDSCKALCNQSLCDEAGGLDPDPAKWLGPPRPGTTDDSKVYRRDLLTVFGCKPKKATACQK